MVKRAFNLSIFGKKSEKELRDGLQEAKKELAKARNDKTSAGGNARLAKVKGLRKMVARHLTVLQHTSREKLRQTQKTALHKSIFLRERLTRAIRRRLSKKQLNKKILKVQKRQQNFPLRKFGLKA